MLRRDAVPRHGGEEGEQDQHKPDHAISLAGAEQRHFLAEWLAAGWQSRRFQLAFFRFLTVKYKGHKRRSVRYGF
jgi:hypothetical protein